VACHCLTNTMSVFHTTPGRTEKIGMRFCLSCGDN
jgi:hypothetical protein